MNMKASDDYCIFVQGRETFFCHVCNYIRSLLILPISTGEQTRSTKKHEIPPWVHVFPAHSTLVCSFKDLKDLWFSLWLHQVLNKCCVSLCFCFWFVLLQPTSGSRQLSVGMWWRVQATWQKVAKLVSIPSCSRQGWTPLWLYGFVWTFIGKPLNPSKSIAYSSLSWPIGSMYAIYGNIYHQYTPNVSIYTIHGSYGWGKLPFGCIQHFQTVTPVYQIWLWTSTDQLLWCPKKGYQTSVSSHSQID